MNTRWKDFFYFQKNDKNAIILLLLLIVICGGLLIGLDDFNTRKNDIAQQKIISEFEGFMQLPANSNTITTAEDETEILQFLETPANKTTGKPVIKKLTVGETIDLNGASVSSLKRIPGIGDEYAKRMYDYQNALGGFTSVDQLKEIKGFSGKRFEKIIPFVTIKKKHKQLKINSLSKEKLLNHPYLSEKQVERIMKIRSENRISNFDDLLKTKDFKPRDKERLSEYISFD